MSVGGKFEYDHHDNFDGYLKALGVPDDKVEKVLNAPNKPITEVTVDGENYSIKRTGGLRDKEIKFTLGQEYEDDLQGHVVKAVTVKDGDNILRTTAKSDRGESEVVSEFTPTELVVTFKDGKTGAVGKRFHKRL